MNKYEIYEQVKDAIEALLPAVVERVVSVKSKIEELPDYPTYSEVARATGSSVSNIERKVREYDIDKVVFRNSRERRIHKTDLLKIVIGDRLLITK